MQAQAGVQDAGSRAAVSTVRQVTDVRDAERIFAVSKALHNMHPSPREYVSRALRIVRNRDPKVLAIIDQTLEVVSAYVDGQVGASIRTHTLGKKTSFEMTEVGLLRAAYEAADKGEPEPSLMWIYLSVCIYAGMIPLDNRTKQAVDDWLDRNRL